MVHKRLFELSNGELRIQFKIAGFDEAHFKAEAAIVRLTVYLVNRGKDPHNFLFDPESIIDKVTKNDSQDVYDDEDNISKCVPDTAELDGSTNACLGAKERKPDEVKDESSDVAEYAKPASESAEVSALIFEDVSPQENALIPPFLFGSAFVNASSISLYRYSRASIVTCNCCDHIYGKDTAVCCPQCEITLKIMNISGVDDRGM